jgi:hypothetical protein
MVTAAGTSAAAPEVRRIYRLMSPVPVSWIPFEPLTTTAPTDPAATSSSSGGCCCARYCCRLLAVVTGGSLSAVARERLRAAASSRGAVIVDVAIGHAVPTAHFTSEVLPPSSPPTRFAPPHTDREPEAGRSPTKAFP